MNEQRIREIANESSYHAENSVDYYSGIVDGLTWEAKILKVRDLKFAELIVKECLNMCADSDAALQRIRDRETSPDSEYVRYGAADYEYAAAYGKQIDHYESIADKATYAGDKIREHFGVEE